MHTRWWLEPGYVVYTFGVWLCSGLLFAAACHDDKPIIKPDPDFANCEAAKDQRENGCLIDSGTRAEFDECIARVRKSCVDGGAK
jgi:hypothetical protein